MDTSKRLGQGKYGDIYEGLVRGGVGLYKLNGPLCRNSVAIILLKCKC